MTDGIPNIGLTEIDEFLSGPVATAEAMNTCVITVGFGDDVNSSLLEGIANGSSCGAYYQAQNAFELRTIYAQTAAEASGENVTVYSGLVSQDEVISAGTYFVEANQSLARFDLIWGAAN